MDATNLLTAAASLLVALPVAYATARKVAGGAALSRALETALREEREVRTPVALVAPDEALDKAAELRTTLLRRGFRTVYVRAAESFAPGKDIFVFLALGTAAPKHLEAICLMGQASGLIFSAPGFRPPAGDWTFANSAVSLYARLRELIAFNRAASTEEPHP